MELQDYLGALRRYWRTLVSLIVIGVLGAGLVVQLSTPTYEATARVFVASTLESTNGSQFISQRVRSYPDIAESLAVLSPVLDDLELETSYSELRDAVSATNPVDTSQIDITVSSSSAEWATLVANAVAEEFSGSVEDLEAPNEGTSPVNLTVTDPATVPTNPVSPDAQLLLALGLVVGTSLGLALAIVGSRMDTTVHTLDDVRALWESDDEPISHMPSRGRGGRSATFRPATQLAGRIEVLAESTPVRVVVVPASPDRRDAPARLLVEVRDELAARGVPARVGAPATEPDDAAARAQVQLQIADHPTGLRDWRSLGRTYHGVVVVIETGRVPAAELRELRLMASAAGVRPLALVLVQPPRSRRLRGTTSPLVGQVKGTAGGRNAAMAGATPSPAMSHPAVPADGDVPVRLEPAGSVRNRPPR